MRSTANLRSVRRAYGIGRGAGQREDVNIHGKSPAGCRQLQRRTGGARGERRQTGTRPGGARGEPKDREAVSSGISTSVETGRRIAAVSRSTTKGTCVGALASGLAWIRSTQTGEVQRSLIRECSGRAVEQRAQRAVLSFSLLCVRQQARGVAASPDAASCPRCCMVQPGGHRCPSRHCHEAPEDSVIRTKATLRSQATPLRL